jgi:hypothetical protein
MTHDYIRNGTTTRFAWLGRHSRFTFHFTPTSASWLNAVEGFFAKLTKQRLKRGVFHSLVSLQAAINSHDLRRAAPVSSTIRARQTCFCGLLRSSAMVASRSRSPGRAGRHSVP